MIYGRVMTPQGVVRVPVRVSVQRAGLPQFVLQGLPGQTRQLRQILLIAMKSIGWKMPHGRVVVDCQLPAGMHWGTQGLSLAIAMALLRFDWQDGDLDVIGVLELDGTLTLPGTLVALLLPLGGSLLTAPPPPGVSRAFQQPQWRFVTALSESLKKEYPTVHPDSASCHALPLQPSLALDPLHLLCLSLVWAGGHSLLLFGSPGEGKTLSRTWLEALAPQLSASQLSDRAALSEIWSNSPLAQVTLPAPTDGIAKWTHPRSGWLRRAAQGVIWLDEFSAVSLPVRTRLRAWIEDTDPETISLRTRHWQAAFVATMNPCPCGYWGETRCVCTRAQVAQLLSRVSWPLLDRFALQWRVEAAEGSSGAISATEFTTLRRQIQNARSKQLRRAGRLNGMVSLADLPTDILRTNPAWRQRLSQWSTRRQVQFCQVVQTLIDGEWSDTVEKACETAWFVCRGTEFLRAQPTTAR